MKKFLIAEAEKARILGMHYKAMGKSLVNEQDLPNDMWSKYIEATNDTKPGSRTITIGPNLLSNEQIKNYKTYDVGFIVSDNRGGTQQAQYQCIDSEPGERVFKAGQIYDSTMNLTNIAKELDAAGVPWRQMFDWACKPAMSVLAARKAKNAPQPQVAAATTAKVTAPNPNSDAQSAADAQKRSEASKAQRQQQMTEFQKLISTPGFLDSTKDDTTLDNEVTQLSKYLGLQFKPLDSEGIRSLLTSMSRLVKAKPKYGAEPYGLTDYINTLRTEL